MRMMVMSFRGFVNVRTKKCTWKKNTSGKFLSWWTKDSSRFTISKFCTEIWNLPIFSCIKMEPRNLETSMLAKSPKKAYFTHRQAHPTTPPLRCGKTSPTTSNPIFGRSAVLFTRCALWCRHSGQMIWTGSSRRSSKVNTPQFPAITQWICDLWLRLCCKWCHREDPTPLRF